MTKPNAGLLDTTVLLVDGRGVIVARSGPSTVLEAFDGPRSKGLPPIAIPFEGDERAWVMEALRHAGKEDARARPIASTARLSTGRGRARFNVTLHPLREDLIAITLISVPESGEVNTPGPRSILSRAWAHMSDAYAFCTPDDGVDGPRIVATNPALDRLFGRRAEGLAGTPVASLLSPGDSERVLHRIRRHFVDGMEPLVDVAAVVHPSGGRALVEWELAPVTDEGGRIWSLICVVRDTCGPSRWISGRRGRDLDPMTGLPNQIHLMGRLERSVERVTQARTYAFAVVGLEIAGLEAVHQKLGTVVSNTVVDALVWRVKQSLRPGDVIARVDDDRLAILLDHFGPWGSMDDVLERIRTATQTPFTVGGERIRVSVVGAAGPVWSHEHPASSAQQVMDEVDRALAQARTRSMMPGDPDAPRHATRRVPWFDLAEAIRSGWLRLVYLPIVSTDTEEVVAMEALVRCRVPEGGVLAGREFVKDAERTGLAVRLGRWVTRHAFRQIAEWQQHLASDESPPVHINLSGPEFWYPDLVEDLKRGAEEVAVHPSRLRLEITETTILRDVPAASAILAELREAGFETWLDRLGEGGLPLRELPKLPLSHVKIAPLPAWGGVDNDDRELPHMLRSLLSMAAELGWHISATGIETSAQWRMIRDAGFESGQGFALFEPIAATETVAFLRQAV